MSLDELRLDLAGKAPEEAFEEGRKLFIQLYVEPFPGGLQLPDGHVVRFHKDRYDHAFRSSHERSWHAYSKAKVALDRIERIRWIGEMLQGRVPDAQCALVPPKPPHPDPHRWQRIYVSWQHLYVVWLQPVREGEWRFSSAYTAPAADIRRYLATRRACEKKAPRD